MASYTISQRGLDVVKAQLEHVINEMREVLAANEGAAIVQVSARRELEQWRATLELVNLAVAGEPVGLRCTPDAHWSIPGLDRCECGQMALTARALAGRPIVYAAPAPGYEPVKCGDIELVAVQLPPNCSINVDIDLTIGDAPAPPFISIRRAPEGLVIHEEDGHGRTS